MTTTEQALNVVGNYLCEVITSDYHHEIDEAIKVLVEAFNRQTEQSSQLEQDLNDLRNIQASESDALSKRIGALQTAHDKLYSGVLELDTDVKRHEKRLDKHSISIIKLEELEEEHETQRIERIEHIDITQSHEDRLAKLEPCRHNKNVSLIHTCHTNPSSMAVIYHCNECGCNFDANGNEIEQPGPIKPDYADLLVHMYHILTSIQRIENGSQTYSTFFFDEIKETLEQAKPVVATFDTPEPETETLAVWRCKVCDEEYSGEVQRCDECNKSICDDCYRKDAGKIICDSCWGKNNVEPEDEETPATRIRAHCEVCLEKYFLIVHKPIGSYECYKCNGKLMVDEEITGNER
jgi:hypothetical protein